LEYDVNADLSMATTVMSIVKKNTLTRMVVARAMAIYVGETLAKAPLGLRKYVNTEPSILNCQNLYSAVSATHIMAVTKAVIMSHTYSGIKTLGISP
jgi:hypothetical protein